jgi:hypothetical protein
MTLRMSHSCLASATSVLGLLKGELGTPTLSEKPRV